jgi:signal transduction histidine kinase
LGLSVVHGIVNAHGGEIHVDTVLGEGSKFTVRLPVSASTGHGGMRR